MRDAVVRRLRQKSKVRDERFAIASSHTHCAPMLAGVLPFLADEAIIFVDDANDRNIRMAVHKFELAYPTQLLKFMDISTPGNCWPMFWNGVLALAWKRSA